MTHRSEPSVQKPYTYLSIIFYNFINYNFGSTERANVVPYDQERSMYNLFDY